MRYVGRLQLIRPRLRVAALLDVERSQHGGAEPMHVVFDDVIRGSRLQILHGGLVSQPAGHDDDRGSRSELLRERERVGRAERRQRMVGEDDVWGELPQRCGHGFARIDPEECATMSARRISRSASAASFGSSSTIRIRMVLKGPAAPAAPDS